MKKKFLCLIFIAIIFVGWFSFALCRYLNQIVVLTVTTPIYSFQDVTIELNNALRDSSVKALVLYIESPGGYAYPCIEIAEQVKNFVKKKPLIVVMGSECTSGAYYIASFATEVITYNNTVTGGIGVLAIWVDLTKYYEQQGIKIWVWSTGEEKDFGAPWRSPTENEKASIQAEVNRIFNKITEDIRNNRNLTSEVVENIKSGRIIYGYEAVEIGLADKVGDINTAIDDAAKISGLTLYIVVPSNMDSTTRFLRALGLV
ncbi:MAG: signal peptide peptidase SppA [Candidatus Bathyarchaeota archaeon]|nr:signal peptide peptidase SppA [Candidatus Bathyarchaeota archaeon]